MSDLSIEVPVSVSEQKPEGISASGQLLEGSHSHSHIYVDQEQGKVVKEFIDPKLPENVKQYELYRDYGKVSPLLSPYFEEVLPDGRGLVLKFIPNSELLADLGRAGTLKLTDEEEDKALGDLKAHQLLTKSIMYGQDIHPENVRVQTMPDGSHNIFLMDVGGKVDGEVSQSEMQQEQDTYKRLLDNNSL